MIGGSENLRSVDVLPQFELGAEVKKRSPSGQRVAPATDIAAALDTHPGIRPLHVRSQVRQTLRH